MLSRYFLRYNFCRIHTSLRITPATTAGIIREVYGLEKMMK